MSYPDAASTRINLTILRKKKTATDKALSLLSLYQYKIYVFLDNRTIFL